MRLTILLVFISIGCFGQVTGTAKSYSELSQQDKLQRAIDSLDNIAKVNANFLAQVKRDATIRAQKGKGHGSLLHGKLYGSKFSNLEQEAAIWIILKDLGYINFATNKIDSTLNFIK